MIFKRVDPIPSLAHVVREFWIVEDENTTPVSQKIIPDGYCEIVVHYGSPYRINLRGTWQDQSRLLLSTQITRFFYLKNTGRSGMLGIKMQPTAPYALFGLQMPDLTDKVIDLNTIQVPAIASLQEITDREMPADKRLMKAQQWVADCAEAQISDKAKRIQAVVAAVMDRQGLVDIELLAREHAMTRRHLEREFKTIVGITPKFFARIQQFNYIFEALKNRDRTWVDVALNSGYFDQSHFIKSFKTFTGEQPSQYGFDEENMANFFLKR